jgi:hypothetical protein
MPQAQERIELFNNFSFQTTTTQKQQNAEHFAWTCSITNRYIEQVQYTDLDGFSGLASVWHTITIADSGVEFALDKAAHCVWGNPMDLDDPDGG